MNNLIQIDFSTKVLILTMPKYFCLDKYFKNNICIVFIFTKHFYTHSFNYKLAPAIFFYIFPCPPKKILGKTVA